MNDVPKRTWEHNTGNNSYFTKECVMRKKTTEKDGTIKYSI